MKRKCFSAKTWQNVFTNVALGVLILSVGTLCFAPTENIVPTKGEEANVYRGGNADNNAVSLTFNVYWGTEEVYEILDILSKRQKKATFFIGGCWADDNVACLRAIADAGHEIGNHGYFHKDHAKLSAIENEKEIMACNRFISLAIGYKITLFAPPSGAYGEATLSACKRLGLKTVLWSKDTIDWRDKDANLIYNRATKSVKAGDFILMHPTKKTVEALDDILEYYRELNLKPITVSEKLQEIG
jgi:peptidoglycan/xylan/chitin deacetylase (PgdA/CDA1 family)